MFESMQKNVAKLQAELESKTFTVKSGGGMVKTNKQSATAGMLGGMNSFGIQ